MHSAGYVLSYTIRRDTISKTYHDDHLDGGRLLYLSFVPC